MTAADLVPGRTLPFPAGPTGSTGAEGSAGIALPVPVPAAAATERTATREAAGELTYVRSIRAIAMIAIVTLHVAFPLVYLYDTAPYGDWWAGSLFYLFGKAGSPLFVMVSGLLLLDPGRSMSTSSFFRKRFVKVLFPFLAWAVIYLVYRMVMKAEVMGPRDILDAFLTGPVYYHLWFIQMILGLYLATPILRIYIRGATRQDLAYFLGVWFVGLAVLPIITRFTGLEFGIEVMVATGFVGFYVLGYALKPVVLDRRGIRLAIAAIVGCVAFTQLATHALTVARGGLFDNFWVRNESINIIALAVSVFLLLKSLDWDALFARVRGLRFVLMGISTNSLGIYFVHVLVIETLALGWLHVTLDGQSFLPVLAIPAVSALVLVISAVITVALKRIPVVRAIVP